MRRLLDGHSGLINVYDRYTAIEQFVFLLFHNTLENEIC